MFNEANLVNMTIRYWNCSYTTPKRYDYLGATWYALSHAKRKKKAIIIDVGCSTGEAMAECKKCLIQHGASVHAIGIDMSREVATSADSKLDEFINKDVLDVDGYKGGADIVMCLNVTRFVTWNVRHEIIRKCAWFLNNEGMLITGIDDEHIKKIVLEPSPSSPKCVCCDMSWVGRLKRSFRSDPKDTRMMRRSEAYNYANILTSEWEDLNLFKKYEIQARISFQRFFSIVLPKYTRRLL